jgi:hypothetical protein
MIWRDGIFRNRTGLGTIPPGSSNTIDSTVRENLQEFFMVFFPFHHGREVFWQQVRLVRFPVFCCGREFPGNRNFFSLIAVLIPVSANDYLLDRAGL